MKPERISANRCRGGAGGSGGGGGGGGAAIGAGGEVAAAARGRSTGRGAAGFGSMGRATGSGARGGATGSSTSSSTIGSGSLADWIGGRAIAGVLVMGCHRPLITRRRCSSSCSSRRPTTSGSSAPSSRNRLKCRWSLSNSARSVAARTIGRVPAYARRRGVCIPGPTIPRNSRASTTHRPCPASARMGTTRITTKIRTATNSTTPHPRYRVLGSCLVRIDTSPKRQRGTPDAQLLLARAWGLCSGITPSLALRACMRAGPTAAVSTQPTDTRARGVFPTSGTNPRNSRSGKG